MTLADIKNALHSELNQGAFCGGYDSPLIADYELTDKGYKKIKAAINRIKPANKGQRKFFTDLEHVESDFYDSVYAYFVFMEL